MSLQVELLEQSFEAIKPNAEEFVNSFYENLLAANPEAKPLFDPSADSFVSSFYENLLAANPEAKPLFDTTNMAEQKKKLLNSLVLVVENLRMPEVLDSALRGLGARHVKYGVLLEHYPLVGSALLTTFEQYLGEKWTPKVKQAWADAYEVLSQIMIDGANYSQSDIALESPSDDIDTSSSSVSQPLSPATVNSQTSDFNSSITEEEMEIKPDKDKVGLYALTGGGIIGIIAVILIVLL